MCTGRKFRIHVVMVMIALFVRCTWESARNETEFCRHVFSCTRNNTNQAPVVEEETDHYENDTDICELARRCTTTVNTTIEESYHQRISNQTEFCSILNSCKYKTNAESHDYDLQYLRNISHYCPYTDHCGMGASRYIPPNDKTSISCCASCNCKPDCGKNRECCFFRQDKYRAVQTENLTCIDITIASVLSNFYMVDTCPNGTKCYDEEKGLVLNPVSSTQTKRIYINKQCADCHFQDTSYPEPAYISWSVNVKERNPHIDNVLSCASRACSAVYGFPRSHWSWIKNFACGRNYKHFCPQSTQDQWLIDACANIHAPVFVPVHGQGNIFGNSYCMMCHNFMARYDSRELCDSTIGDVDRGHSLSILLDLDTIQKHKEIKACDKNNATVTMHRQQVSGRPVLCPEWTLKVNDRCLHFTKQWRNAYVDFQLILRPNNNEQIKASSFQNMTKRERFHFYTWLSNECHLDLNVTDPVKIGTKVKVYMLPVKRGNVIMIKEFLLRIEYAGVNLKPPSVLALIKRCVEGAWKIKRDGSVYHLSATFYRYRDFMPDGKTTRKHVSLNKTYFESPLPKMYVPITVTRPFYYYGATEYYALRFQSVGVKVTKMAFCERVELCMNEVELLFGQIRVRFNNKTLGDAEFSTRYSYDNKGKPTLTQIYVCKKDIGLDVKNAGVPQSTLSFLKIVTLLVVNVHAI